MTISNRKRVTLYILIFSCLASIAFFEFQKELTIMYRYINREETALELFPKSRNNFTLKTGESYQLINSAIKQDYGIFFSGNIVNFDTLFIGKGFEDYLSSYITINRDSIIFNKISNVKTRKAIKHDLELSNYFTLNIDRKVDSTIVTIINEQDTFRITEDFVGMSSPFVRSSGSVINVDKFEFNCDDYYADVFIFGDSYVNCGYSNRWPYYIYNQGYKFFCDGLPGGSSEDSYCFINSALTVNKPKYVIWCLGMNDGGDRLGTNLIWKYYINKVMDLCLKNKIELILTTIPSTPNIDNTGKNNFIRESGYRYIDFDKVVSDGQGNWVNGMLAKDGSHPTEMGAKAMAMELLIKFPEIKKYKR
jgi:hypothetical protein